MLSSAKQALSSSSHLTIHVKLSIEETEQVKKANFAKRGTNKLAVSQNVFYLLSF